MKISICICTFKRPDMLRALLNKIFSQDFEKPSKFLQIVVTDNDPDHSARDILLSFPDTKYITLVSLHIKAPNISAARNTCIHAADGELIALIDDDEIPVNDWLTRLLGTMTNTGAGVVFGPVIPRYSLKTPDWILHGQYFERKRYKTGEHVPIEETRTGNVLIKKTCLKGIDGPFDLNFGRTGGEDTLFFKQLKKNGIQFSWCDEAIVEESVPLERATAKWLLQRSYRIGQTWARIELTQFSGLPLIFAWLRIFSKSLLQLSIAALLSLALGILFKNQSFRWLRTSVAQAGKLTALAGHQFNEYGK